MRRTAIGLVLLLVVPLIAAGLSVAEVEEVATPAPFNPDAYPREVQKLLQRARDECKSEGGESVTVASDTIRVLDLTGDGRDDYIVSFDKAECKGWEDVYCGTGGCILAIIMALRGGGTRTVFSGQVRRYEILPGRGARTIRFELHGSYCGGHGNPSCIRMHVITARPFKFKAPE